MVSTNILLDTLSNEFVVCVCGGRDYNNKYELFKFLDKVHSKRPISKIIEGGARGADSLAGEWAVSRHVSLHVENANWDQYGNRAGPIRNRVMIKMNPDVVIAFPGGTGTKDMIRASTDAGIPVYEFKESYTHNIRKDGNLLKTNCDVLVNPVNSVGVMGKGLARQFADKFPKTCASYNAMMRTATTRAQIFENSKIKYLANPSLHNIIDPGYENKSILMFPTKIDFRDGSDLKYIEHSLTRTRVLLDRRQIQSIAFPKVGCGLGGLDWSEVKPLFDKYLSGYKGHVEFYL